LFLSFKKYEEKIGVKTGTLLPDQVVADLYLRSFNRARTYFLWITSN
jgi:hypothetical protein